MAVLEIGKRFGRLTLVHRTDDSRWLCRCDCGGIKDVSSKCLYNKSTKSCGCLLNEHGSHRRILTVIQCQASTFQHLYRIHVNKARTPTHLSFNQWRAIVVLPCFYCGGTDTKTKYSAPSLRRLQPHLSSKDFKMYEIKANGIDRLNPFAGYTVKNSVSCCKRCNGMKSNMPLKVFIELCGKIYKRTKPFLG